MLGLALILTRGRRLSLRLSLDSPPAIILRTLQPSCSIGLADDNVAEGSWPVNNMMEKRNT